MHAVMHYSQANEEECDVSKGSNALNEAEENGQDQDNDYVDNPVNNISSSPTNQVCSI